MVTGHVPFEGKDIYRQIVAIRECEPPLLSKSAAAVPERLEEIIQRALAKNPNERYRGAEDLLIDLQSLKRKLEIDEELTRSAAHELTGTSAVAGQSFAQDPPQPLRSRQTRRRLASRRKRP